MNLNLPLKGKNPENPEKSLAKFISPPYSFSIVNWNLPNILITTITSFYTFNHHIPENCDAKALSYVIPRHPVYNIYDILYK